MGLFLINEYFLFSKMTRDKIIIFKSYKAMHKYAMQLKKYYFTEDNDFRYLARDPDAIYIWDEWGEYIEV